MQHLWSTLKQSTSKQGTPVLRYSLPEIFKIGKLEMFTKKCTLGTFAIGSKSDNTLSLRSFFNGNKREVFFWLQIILKFKLMFYVSVCICCKIHVHVRWSCLSIKERRNDYLFVFGGRRIAFILLLRKKKTCYFYISFAALSSNLQKKKNGKVNGCWRLQGFLYFLCTGSAWSPWVILTNLAKL